MIEKSVPLHYHLMPNGDAPDVIFYPTLTLTTDSYSRSKHIRYWYTAMANHFTIYYGMWISTLLYTISYILYEISYILNKILYIYNYTN